MGFFSKLFSGKPSETEAAPDQAEQAREEELRAEQERIEKEQADKERAEAERAEKERAEKERAERERAEKERAEKERAEKERAEKERAEKERAEKERAEKERAEKERAEKERAEKECAAAASRPTTPLFAPVGTRKTVPAPPSVAAPPAARPWSTATAPSASPPVAAPSVTPPTKSEASASSGAFAAPWTSGRPVEAPRVNKTLFESPAPTNGRAAPVTPTAPEAKPVPSPVADLPPRRRLETPAEMRAPLVAPEIPPPEENPLAAFDGDSFFDELDQSFAGVMEADGNDGGEGTLDNDEAEQAELRETFGKIAAQHVAHVRDLALELRDAPVGIAWVSICKPALSTLHKAAQKMGLGDLEAAIDLLTEALTEAESGTRIDGEHRTAVLERYAELEQILPEAFATDEHRDRREPIILQALLSRIPAVGSIDVYRLYQAGAMSLSALRQATTADLSVTTGIEASTCEAILASINRYLEERAEHAPDEERSAERAKIRELLDKLAACEAEIKESRRGRDERRKRTLRRERNDLGNEIDLVLAQLGELKLIEELVRLPFEQRARRVELWLRETANATKKA